MPSGRNRGSWPGAQPPKLPIGGTSGRGDVPGGSRRPSPPSSRARGPGRPALAFSLRLLLQLAGLAGQCRRSSACGGRPAGCPAAPRSRRRTCPRSGRSAARSSGTCPARWRRGGSPRRHGQDQVRLAELPAVGELRAAAGRPSGRPPGVPPSTHAASVAISASVSRRSLWNGDARRSASTAASCGLRVLLDVVGPVDRLLVGHQRERPDLAGPVARLAVLLQDRQHVPVVGDRRRRPCDRVAAADRAADGLGRRRADRLAGEQVVEGVLQVVVGDLRASSSAGRRTCCRSGRGSAGRGCGRGRTPRA